MRIWSSFWKSSKKPKKQRKYRYTAPNHVKRGMMSSHLSKELRTEHGTRSTPVRVSDIVKVLRGEFRGKSGKVEKVNYNKETVHVEKLTVQKRDGTSYQVGFHPSNLMITKIGTEDKLRLRKRK